MHPASPVAPHQLRHVVGHSSPTLLGLSPQSHPGQQQPQHASHLISVHPGSDAIIQKVGRSSPSSTSSNNNNPTMLNGNMHYLSGPLPPQGLHPHLHHPHHHQTHHQPTQVSVVSHHSGGHHGSQATPGSTSPGAGGPEPTSRPSVIESSQPMIIECT